MYTRFAKWGARRRGFEIPLKVAVAGCDQAWLNKDWGAFQRHSLQIKWRLEWSALLGAEGLE